MTQARMSNSPNKQGTRSTSASLHLSPSLRLKQPFEFTASSPHRPRKNKAVCDRFIPNRQASWLDGARPASCGSSDVFHGPAEETRRLAQACGLKTSRVLEFQKTNVNNPSFGPLDLCRAYTKMDSLRAPVQRFISRNPERVLDAPGIRDDFYLNLLDWAPDNKLAIALGRTVYVWDATTMSADLLWESPDESKYISSIKYSKDRTVAIGLNDGSIGVLDSCTGQKIRTLRHQRGTNENRIMSLAWNSNILSNGSENGTIWQHDIRVPQHNVFQLNGHSDGVLGLAYKNTSGYTLASGSKDHLINIWDCRMNTPQYTFDAHTAAVKALAWCPWQPNLLATGGGRQDRKIHFWNTTTGTRVNSVDSESQVSSIHWSKDSKELVSCHGLPHCNMIVWSYPAMQALANIEDNGARILGSSLAPDGQTLVTCAADENLKFWRIFDPPQRKLGPGSAGSMIIR